MNINKELAVASALCSALIAGATQAAVPNTFGAGQPARAAEVNANFTDLDDRLATLESDAAVVNWATYDPSGYTKKTFSRVRYSGGIPRTLSGCNRIDLDFTDRTDILFTLYPSANPTAKCYEEHEFAVDTGSGFADTGRDEYNDNAGTLYLAREVRHRGLATTPSTVRIGVPFSYTFESDVTNYDQSAAVIGTSVETTLIDRVVVGIENVTVPAGSYTNCLKISQTFSSSSDGFYHRHEWRCPGVGTVKQTRAYTDGRSDIREMLSITSTP